MSADSCMRCEKPRELTYLILISLTLISLVVWFSGCGKANQEQPAARATSQSAVRQDIQISSWQSDQPADILLLIDQSGSMSIGKAPTDPGGLRLQGSRFFLDFVAGRSHTHSPNRFGVINFGSDAPRQHAIPPTVLTASDDPTINQVAAKLVPLNLGDTHFLKALHLAFDFFQQTGSLDDKRYRAIVIFTDGEPDDKRRRQMTRENYFSEIQQFYQEKLQPQGIDVFVVGIDTVGKKWSETIPYWQALVGKDHIFTTPTMPALKEQFNRIVQRIWHLPEAGAVLVANGAPTEVEVEPYLAAIEFNLFPSQPGVALRITRPGGQPVRPGTDPDAPSLKKLGGFERLTVLEPEPGRWRLEVVGGSGKVEVLRNPIPLRMHLISPAQIHPQGKPIEVVAEFKRTDGKPVKPHPDYPLGLTAEINTPAAKRYPIKFPVDKGYDGIFTGESICEDTKTEGIYQIILKVSGGDRYYNQYPVAVQVKPVPYLLVQQPDGQHPVAPGPTIAVKVQLYKNGQPVDPGRLYSNHPDYLVMAQIFQQAAARKGSRVWLAAAKEPDKPGYFVGQVPLPGEREGDYLLVVQLAPELQAQEIIADRTLVHFSVRKPPWPWWYWAGLVLLLGSIIVAGVWLATRPQPFTWYYWAENMPAFRRVDFGRRANEISILFDLPVKLQRQGKSKAVHLEASGAAKLLQSDGQGIPSLILSTEGRFIIQTDTGDRVAVHTAFDQPPSRPTATPPTGPDDTSNLFDDSPGSPSGQSGETGGDDWGFGPTR